MSWISTPKIRIALRFVGWFFLANAFVFWALGSSYLHAILESTSLFKNSIADYSGFLGKSLILFFTIVNYLSYMMLLAFIPGLLVLTCALLVPAKRLVIMTSVVVSSLSLLLLITDVRVYGMFKFHLNSVLISMIFNQQWRGVFDFSVDELMLMFGIAFVVFMIESLMAYFIWNKVTDCERFKISKTIACLWLGGAFFSYFTLMLTIAKNNNLFSQQIPTLPLYNQLFTYAIPDKNAQDILLRYSEHHFSQPLFSNEKMKYPLHPMRCEPPKKPYNVILIMVDSLRFDSMNMAYMPEITQFAAKGWEFKKHFSGGNSTQSALFSLFYSLPSNYWTAALKQNKSPVFIDLLKKYGYSTRIIWSSEMHDPPFHKTIYAGLENLSLDGAPGDDVGNWDRYTTEQAIKFLKTRKNKSPFFLNLFYDAVHGYCRDQSFAAVYQPTHKHCLRIAMTNELDPIPYYNRYLNAVKFVQNEIAHVLATIEQEGLLENSVVIFTSDHGQEFNDNKRNYWGHAGNYTPVQVQIPLIVYWPGETPRIINYSTSSYDVIPTVLKRLFSCHNPLADYSIGQDLLSEQGRLPFVISGSYVNMGIIEPDRLTTLETSGRVNITDLHANPMPHAKPHPVVMSQVLALMRYYF